jgi:hypothetical protein
MKRRRGMWAAILLCWGWRTTHVLLAAGVIERGKRLGQQPSHATCGSARYKSGVKLHRENVDLKRNAAEVKRRIGELRGRLEKGREKKKIRREEVDDGVLLGKAGYVFVQGLSSCSAGRE